MSKAASAATTLESSHQSSAEETEAAAAFSLAAATFLPHCPLPIHNTADAQRRHTAE